MSERLFATPLIVIVAAISAVAMLVPAVYGAVGEDFSVARAFLYAFILGAPAIAVLSISITGRLARTDGDLANLVSLFLAYTVLPLFLALPIHEAIGTTSYLNAYIEMVSCLTTTGASLFEPDRLPDAIHLWRGLVGWLGGLLIWVSAAAVLAPLNLGGFEVITAREAVSDASAYTRFERASGARWLKSCAERLTPIYLGLTLALFVILLIAGDRPLVAAMHAMATLSTSGISPVGGLAQSHSGFAGELAIFVFLLFALSRLTFSRDIAHIERAAIWRDPEFRLGLAIVVVLPLLLFARHWIAAFELAEGVEAPDTLGALWGAVFTVMSFLTTMGFASVHWATAETWSGLSTSGLIVMGVAIFGGGVATTAGGVKLLRVYALGMHSKREMERLIYPHSVGRSRHGGRHLRREGAFIAWVFFMLFALAVSFVILMMCLSGPNFEESIILTVSAITTTGPILDQSYDVTVDLTKLSAWTKGIFTATMVLGRLETLAIIALLNPQFWRN